MISDSRTRNGHREVRSANGDFKAITTTGHNLKGTGSMYGFVPVTDFGARLKRAACAQNADHLRHIAAHMRAYLVAVRWRAAPRIA